MNWWNLVWSVIAIAGAVGLHLLAAEVGRLSGAVASYRTLLDSHPFWDRVHDRPKSRRGYYYKEYKGSEDPIFSPEDLDRRKAEEASKHPEED